MVDTYLMGFDVDVLVWQYDRSDAQSLGEALHVLMYLDDERN